MASSTQRVPGRRRGEAPAERTRAPQRSVERLPEGWTSRERFVEYWRRRYAEAIAARDLSAARAAARKRALEAINDVLEFASPSEREPLLVAHRHLQFDAGRGEEWLLTAHGGKPPSVEELLVLQLMSYLHDDEIGLVFWPKAPRVVAMRRATALRSRAAKVLNTGALYNSKARWRTPHESKKGNV